MNRNFGIIALIALLVLSASAQNNPLNFTGRWEMDVAKSKVDQRGRVEALTMVVVQTAKDIKVETKIKRELAASPSAASSGQIPPGMGRGFGGFGRDIVYTYSLDGIENTTQQDSPMGPIPVKLKAKVEGGKLNLSSIRTLNGPNGELLITTKEAWTLSPDGKTLTIEREQTSPRGPLTSELVFVKK